MLAGRAAPACLLFTHSEERGASSSCARGSHWQVLALLSGHRQRSTPQACQGSSLPICSCISRSLLHAQASALRRQHTFGKPLPGVCAKAEGSTHVHVSMASVKHLWVLAFAVRQYCLIRGKHDWQATTSCVGMSMTQLTSSSSTCQQLQH